MTTLGTSGGFFTINGTRKFLIGQSYFHGAAARLSDLDAFQMLGYSFVRIFLDWVDETTESVTRSGTFSLFNSDGTLKSAKSTLLDFIRAADRRGIICDLTLLNGATDGWITNSTDRTSAVTNAVTYFGSEPNVLFDLVNEADQCGSYLTTFAQLTAIVSAARAAHATVPLTISMGCSVTSPFDGDGPFMNETTNVVDSSYMTSWMGTGISFPAPHFKGNTAWWSDKGTRVANLRAWMDANGHSAKPIYINEDNRWGVGYGDTGAGDIEADKYLFSALAAKTNNAGAIIQHSNASYNLSGGGTFRSLFANADEQDCYDRLVGYIDGNGTTDIAFDAASNSSVGTATNSLTWNHTVGAGLRNGLLRIGTGARGNSAGNLVVQSVTVGGVACVKQREDISGDIGGEFCGTSQWILTNPTAGVRSIVVTFTGSVSNVLTAFAVSYARVHQTRPVNAVGGGSATTGSVPRVLLTSTEPRSLIVDAVYQGDDPAMSVGTLQTARSNRVVTGVSTDNAGGSDQAAPVVCTTPMSWLCNPTFWAQSVLALNSDGEDRPVLGTVDNSTFPKPRLSGAAE